MTIGNPAGRKAQQNTTPSTNDNGALWSLFHLAEELEHRTDVTHLSRSDLAHLSGDLRRAHAALAVEWLGRLGHLKGSYPYLFSPALRRNPLDPSAWVGMPE